MGEFKRIFSWKMIIIMLAAVITGLFMFTYSQLKGKSISQIKDEQRLYEQLIDKYSKMDLEEAVDLVGGDSIEILSQGENSEKLEFLRYVKEKLEYLSGYNDNVNQVINNANRMTMFSVFANESSWTNANIKKTAQDYRRVQNVSLQLVNDRAFEAFFDYSGYIYVVLVVMVFVVYTLFSERENGMWGLVHTYSKGRGYLGVKRCILLAVTSFIMLAVSYISTLIVSLFIYGGWRAFGTPIQTIEDFQRFTFASDKFEFILMNFLLIWFVMFVVTLLVWALFVLCRNNKFALVVTAAVIGIEVLLYYRIDSQSLYRVFKNVNIVRLLNITGIYGSYENMGFGTYVIPVFNVMVVVLFILFAVSTVITIAGTQKMRPYAGKSIVSKIIDWINAKYQRVFWKCGVTAKEFHKLIFTGKGMWVFVVALVATVYFTSTGRTAFTDFMKEKDNIYITQGGSNYEGIVSLVNEREAAFEQALEDSKTKGELYSAGKIDYGEYIAATYSTKEYKNKLDIVNEFSEKIVYLERIESEHGIKGYMVSERGYEEIFGDKSKGRELVLLLVMTVATILVVSESAMLECRTGMKFMLTAADKGRKWLTIRKLVAVFAFTSLVFLLIYGIDMYSLYKYYGMPHLDAPLISLTFMEGKGMPTATIGQRILFRIGLRYVFALFTMGVAFVSSKAVGSKIGRAVVPVLSVVMLIVAIVIEKMGWLL